MLSIAYHFMWLRLFVVNYISGEKESTFIIHGNLIFNIKYFVLSISSKFQILGTICLLRSSASKTLFPDTSFLSGKNVNQEFVLEFYTNSSYVPTCVLPLPVFFPFIIQIIYLQF